MQDVPEEGVELQVVALVAVALGLGLVGVVVVVPGLAPAVNGRLSLRLLLARDLVLLLMHRRREQGRGGGDEEQWEGGGEMHGGMDVRW